MLKFQTPMLNDEVCRANLDHYEARFSKFLRGVPKYWGIVEVSFQVQLLGQDTQLKISTAGMPRGNC